MAWTAQRVTRSRRARRRQDNRRQYARGGNLDEQRRTKLQGVQAWPIEVGMGSFSTSQQIRYGMEVFNWLGSVLEK